MKIYNYTKLSNLQSAYGLSPEDVGPAPQDLETRCILFLRHVNPFGFAEWLRGFTEPAGIHDKLFSSALGEVSANMFSNSVSKIIVIYCHGVFFFTILSLPPLCSLTCDHHLDLSLSPQVGQIDGT